MKAIIFIHHMDPQGSHTGKDQFNRKKNIFFRNKQKHPLVISFELPLKFYIIDFVNNFVCLETKSVN